jgi:hypothetical protein
MQRFIKEKPSPEDRVVARQHAVEVARLLNSEAVSYRRIVVEEPQCLYRVPFHADDFWFKILFSDTEFVFTGEHRRCGAYVVPFCAAIKRSWPNLVATKHLCSLSSELGIDVYTTDAFTQETVASHLLTPVVRKLIRQLDFFPVSLFFLNSVQVHVVSELISPEHCAKQARLLRELLLTIYHQTHY